MNLHTCGSHHRRRRQPRYLDCSQSLSSRSNFCQFHLNCCLGVVTRKPAVTVISFPVVISVITNVIIINNAIIPAIPFTDTSVLVVVIPLAVIDLAITNALVNLILIDFSVIVISFVACYHLQHRYDCSHCVCGEVAFIPAIIDIATIINPFVIPITIILDNIAKISSSMTSQMGSIFPNCPF